MRKLLLPSIVIIAAFLLLIRIFYLQVINDTFKLKSENNAIKIQYEYPERGYIYDRNGKLLVANQASYDIMVIPREIKNLDTLELCQLLDVSKEEFLEKIYHFMLAGVEHMAAETVTFPRLWQRPAVWAASPSGRCAALSEEPKHHGYWG